jgi:serine/threonine-protein kinase
MRTILAIVVIFAVGLTAADARRRQHHRYHGYANPTGQRANPLLLPSDRRPYGYVVPRDVRDPVAPEVPSQGAAELVPPSWQLQPADPNWDGHRYLSPDGSAWLSLYARPAEAERVAADMKAFAFIDGEEIISMSAQRDWIMVSGSKGDKIFYRKAVLACGGKSWHNLAFEYPTDAKGTMDAVASRSARALDNTRNDGCQVERASE